MKKVIHATLALLLLLALCACSLTEKELLEPKDYELVPDVRGWGVDAYYLKDGVFIYLEFGYLEDGQEVISGISAYVLATNMEGVDF